jgi:hypothetical protein
MAVDVTAYAKELMDEAGISDAEQRKQFESFFGNPKVQAKFTNVLTEATEGVQRERGRTAAEKQRADAAVKAQTDYYQQQLKLANDNAKIVSDAQAQVQAYVDLYGELPGGQRPTPSATRQAVQDMIDKKTFDERTAALEGNTLGLIKTAVKLMDQHRREFPNDPFDVDKIVDVATEKGMTAAQAYESIVGAKREELRQAKIEADKKAAIEAALIEDRSKRGASQISDSSPKSEFMTNFSRQQKPTTAQESFIKGWREPEPGKVSKQEFGRT